MQDDEGAADGRTTMSLKERLIEGLLVVGIIACIGILAAMLRMMLVHILSGLLFMGVAAYTVLRGQEARTRLHRLLWFVSTGLVIFLFSCCEAALFFLLLLGNLDTLLFRDFDLPGQDPLSSAIRRGFLLLLAVEFDGAVS